MHVIFNTVRGMRGIYYVNVYKLDDTIKYGQWHKTKSLANMYAGMSRRPIYRIKVTLKCG